MLKNSQYYADNANYWQKQAYETRKAYIRGGVWSNEPLNWKEECMCSRVEASYDLAREYLVLAIEAKRMEKGM